jgi:hypothetical protein
MFVSYNSGLFISDISASAPPRKPIATPLLSGVFRVLFVTFVFDYAGEESRYPGLPISRCCRYSKAPGFQGLPFSPQLPEELFAHIATGVAEIQEGHVAVWLCGIDPDAP